MRQAVAGTSFLRHSERLPEAWTQDGMTAEVKFSRALSRGGASAVCHCRDIARDLPTGLLLRPKPEGRTIVAPVEFGKNLALSKSPTRTHLSGAVPPTGARTRFSSGYAIDARGLTAQQVEQAIANGFTGHALYERPSGGLSADVLHGVFVVTDVCLVGVVTRDQELRSAVIAGGQIDARLRHRFAGLYADSTI